jgi:hypothetical protein
MLKNKKDVSCFLQGGTKRVHVLKEKFSLQDVKKLRQDC